MSHKHREKVYPSQVSTLHFDRIKEPFDLSLVDKFKETRTNEKKSQFVEFSNKKILFCWLLVDFMKIL